MGPGARNESADGGVMDDLPNVFGSETRGWRFCALLSIKRSLARIAQLRTMKAPVAAAWIAFPKFSDPKTLGWRSCALL